MKIESRTLNHLLEYITESDNIGGNPIHLSKELIDRLKTKGKVLPDSNVDELENYALRIDQMDKGGHKHDGQLVEYKIEFTSPKGDKTVIHTDMALAQGWNFHKDQEIK